MPTASPRRKYTLAEAGVRIKFGTLVEDKKGLHPSTVRGYVERGWLDASARDERGRIKYITERAIQDYERRMHILAAKSTR